jgi:hypothetical protein
LPPDEFCLGTRPSPARASWSLVMLVNRALAVELQRELQKAVRGA